jgi:heme/copper-type cytochrome/quinol oxidase subunit 4
MKKNHINDVEIQQYVLRKADCDNLIIEHIHHCQKCKTEVEIYELLFTEIKKESNPVFDFDLANLVMQQLPEKQYLSFDKYLIVLLLCVSITALSVLIYLTNYYFPTVFNGISSIQFSLIMVTVLLISIFIYVDMKKNYKAQMNFS